MKLLSVLLIISIAMAMHIVRECNFRQAERCGITNCYISGCIIVTRDAMNEHLWHMRHDDLEAADRWLTKWMFTNVETLYDLGPRSNQTSLCLPSGVNCQTAPNACCVKDSCYMDKGRGEMVCW